MPVTRTCTFCGNDIEPGTGKMFIRRDGTIHFFCSSKCQKNLLELGRVGRKVRWTRRYVKALQVQAPRKPMAAEAKVVVEEVPAEETEEEARIEAEPVTKADVLEDFTQVRGIGPTTAQALVDAGFTSMEMLRKAKLEELTEVKGIGPATAKKILGSLKEKG